MSNMSYVRFEHTYKDLVDCYEHLFDEDLSESEEKYRRWLIRICTEIANEFGDEDV